MKKKLMICFEYVIRTSNSHEPYKELHRLHRRPVILFFNSVDSVFKRLQFEWFKLLLSVPFLKLEWGRLCSDISFWGVKQVLAMCSQLCACIINWMDCCRIDLYCTGCDFAPTDNSELTQQDGRLGRRRQTLCDKRDNNFVCNNFSPNFAFL